MNFEFKKKIIQDYLIPLLIGVVIAMIINTFFMRTVVPTGSMLPTIQLNDQLLIRKIYNTKSLKRGDVIVFEPNTEQGEKLYIKRLIGLPGDTIKFELIDGISTVWINGEKLDEPYVTNLSMEDISTVYHVPKNSYFFLGDNRAESYDSRYWQNSYIHKSQIKGKMVLNFSQFLNNFKNLISREWDDKIESMSLNL